MKGSEEYYPDYPLFKGLQQPLELMGLQGRYIYWAQVWREEPLPASSPPTVWPAS